MPDSLEPLKQQTTEPPDSPEPLKQQTPVPPGSAATPTVPKGELTEEQLNGVSGAGIPGESMDIRHPN